MKQAGVKRKLLYIDQLVGPTSLDIVNALSKSFEVHLYAGSIIKTYTDLNPAVKLHRRPRYSKTSFVSRTFSWFAFYATTFPAMLFTRKDELFLVSNPPINFLLGLVFHKLGGIRFSLLLFDLYPDIIIQYGYLSARNPISNLWRYLNKITFPKAHCIVTLSDGLSKVAAGYNSRPDNMIVVPSWTNTDEIKPVPRNDNEFIRRHDLSKYFLVMYSGNMGKTHDLETILDVALKLKDKSDIKFVLIGDGTKKPMIVDRVRRDVMSNVLVLPFQEPSSFRHSIACADIGFVTLSEGFENYSVPSKTYYLLAAGCIIFVIASKESELETIVTRHQCGFRFGSGEADLIAERILVIQQDQAARRRLSENSREASGHFTMSNADIIADAVSKHQFVL